MLSLTPVRAGLPVPNQRFLAIESLKLPSGLISISFAGPIIRFLRIMCPRKQLEGSGLEKEKKHDTSFHTHCCPFASVCGASIITRANVCDYVRQRCISIQIKSKTENSPSSTTRKGKKAKTSSAHLARFLLRFEALLSPVFGLSDGPHTPPTSD